MNVGNRSSRTVLEFVRCIVIAGLVSAVSVPAKDIAITVNSGATHTFHGWGGSAPAPHRATQFTHVLTAPVRDSLAKMVWGDLDYRYFRMCPYVKNDGTPTASYFASAMQPLIDEARVHQDSLILVLTPMNSGGFDSTNTQAWVNRIAQFIKDLKDDHGLEIRFTAVENEPPSAGVPYRLVPQLIREFRAALDSRELQNVGVIGPQYPSVQSRLYNQANLFADVDAVSSLHAWAFHSYSMSLTKEAADTVFKHGIPEIWQMEAGTCDRGTEAANDSGWSATAAGLFLGDVNLGTSVWAWFLPYANVDNWANDSTRRVKAGIRYIGYDVGGSSEILVYPKYYYFKQLSKAFRRGTSMRLCTSNLGSDDRQKYMEGRHGTRPHVHAAAGIAANGQWSIALVNVSGAPNRYWIDGDGVAHATMAFPAAEAANVTFFVEELAAADSMVFSVERTNGTVKNQDAGMVTMRNGEVSVTIQPCELVTLIAADGSVDAVRGIRENRQGAAIRMVPVVKGGVAGYTLHLSGEYRGAKAVSIRNTQGKLVRKLDISEGVGTSRTVFWDGTGSRGAAVPPGLYTVRGENKAGVSFMVIR